MPSMLEERNHVLETLFGNVKHCIVVVDRDGRISYMNESYGRFLEVDPKEIAGRHVTEVIENTRMHIVVDTGEEEMADLPEDPRRLYDRPPDSAPGGRRGDRGPRHGAVPRYRRMENHEHPHQGPPA